MKMIHVYNSADYWFMTVHVIIWNLHNGCFTLICTDGASGAPAQSGLEHPDDDGAELAQTDSVNISNNRVGHHDDDGAELAQPENVNIGDDGIPAETAGIC